MGTILTQKSVVQGRGPCPNSQSHLVTTQNRYLKTAIRNVYLKTAIRKANSTLSGKGNKMMHTVEDILLVQKKKKKKRPTLLQKNFKDDLSAYG